MNEELEVQKKRVKDFLESLTQTEQMLIDLYYYKETAVPDIAKLMELSETKVSEILTDIISRCTYDLGKG